MGGLQPRHLLHIPVTPWRVHQRNLQGASLQKVGHTYSCTAKRQAQEGDKHVPMLFHTEHTTRDFKPAQLADKE